MCVYLLLYIALLHNYQRKVRNVKQYYNGKLYL